MGRRPDRDHLGKEGSANNWSLDVVQSARIKPEAAWTFRSSAHGNQSVANSTWTVLELETKAKVTANDYDIANYTYVAPSAGSYKATGHTRFVSVSDGTLFQVQLEKSTDDGAS